MPCLFHNYFFGNCMQLYSFIKNDDGTFNVLYKIKSNNGYTLVKSFLNQNKTEAQINNIILQLKLKSNTIENLLL